MVCNAYYRKKASQKMFFTNPNEYIFVFFVKHIEFACIAKCYINKIAFVIYFILKTH